MIIKKTKKGQLLIEVLIGIGIIAILVSAVVPLILSSTAALSRERKNQTAEMLAKEQIEAARALKDQDWNTIYFPLNSSNKGLSNPYHLSVNSGSWQLTAGSENVTLNGNNFQRYLLINNVSRTSSNGTGEIPLNYNPLQNYNSALDDPSTQKITSVVTQVSGQPIIITEYFTRWSNLLWKQTDWSGGINSNWTATENTYASVNNVDPSSAGILTLSTTGVSNGEYGNKFLISATGTIGRLNHSSKQASMRFTAQKNGVLSQLRLYINNAQNSGGIIYRFGIQADNSGLPQGTFLSSGTASIAAPGWQSINLSPALNITSGTTYHFVVRYDSGTAPAGNRYIDIRNSLPWNKSVPFNQAIDNNQNTLFHDGANWIVQNSEPIFVLGFNNATFEGNPYDTSQTRSIYGGNYEGEKFSVSANTTVSALNLFLAKSANQNPASPLRVILRDLTANTNLIDDSSINGTALTPTFSWKTITLGSNVVLPSGHQFRLYLSSAASIANRHYLIYNQSNPNTADYNSINWDGVNSIVSRSTDGGANWDDTNQFIDMTGYNFATVLSQSYASSGELVSSAFNATKKAGFNRITWNNVVLPAGTSIQMQLAGNNDNSTWNFLGPDGSTGTFYTISNGENIYYNLSNNQYIRYKVVLSTQNPQVTPTLNDITINYSP